MKKIFVLALVLSSAVHFVSAAPVDVAKAQKAAESFIKLRSTISAESLHIRKAKPLQMRLAPTDSPAYYVFNNGEDGGFVIIAANDCAHPVLAHVDHGHFDLANMPTNMLGWLEGYAKEIKVAEANAVEADDEIAAEWRELIEGTVEQHANVIVEPLIKTHWDQMEPYNNSCPYDKTYKSNAMTGCVATAMAQIMAYWKYPTKGQGYSSYVHNTYGLLSANYGATTYDWANMINDYTYYDSYGYPQIYPGVTALQKKAVATLMSHCGISTQMSYGPDVSGTFIISEYCNTGQDNAEYAFEKYFGYVSDRAGIKGYSITNSDWVKYLKADLDAKRPVIYAGFSNTGGHCFICDGYNDANQYHFNWGWSGVADGYYKLNALNPGEGGAGGADYTYNDAQQAIFGLRPKNAIIDEKFKLELDSKISLADSLWFGENVTPTVDIANYGSEDFTGSIAAVLFDEEGNFMDYMDTKEGSLAAGYKFSFSTTYKATAALTPGKYMISYYYKTENQDWTVIGSTYYTNLKEFVVWYYDGIEAYSDFQLLSGEYKQNKTVKVQVSIANVRDNKTDFKGSLRLDLANLSDGHVAQVIYILEDVTIENGYYLDCWFENTITVDPGTYLLEVAYKNEGSGDWYFVGSYYHPNPIHVVVEVKDVEADPYEKNDEEKDAYVLTPKFDSKGVASFDLNEANIHSGTDVDFYVLDLPEGDKYAVTFQLFDAEDKEEYTIDVNGSYYTSENPIYYAMKGKCELKFDDGLKVYFLVRPKMAGEKGYYDLKVHVQRNPDEAIDNVDAFDENVRVIDIWGRTVHQPANPSSKVQVVYPMMIGK